MKDAKSEHFYIRTGPAAADLLVSKIRTYFIEWFDREGLKDLALKDVLKFHIQAN